LPNPRCNTFRGIFICVCELTIALEKKKTSTTKNKNITKKTSDTGKIIDIARALSCVFEFMKIIFFVMHLKKKVDAFEPEKKSLIIRSP